jgi:hypothetical protein
LPRNLESIGAYAFRSSPSAAGGAIVEYIGASMIPGSVIKIANNVFNNKTS